MDELIIVSTITISISSNSYAFLNIELISIISSSIEIISTLNNEITVNSIIA